MKYHQGFSSNVMTSGGEIHLAMAFNPSHLEIVSPVVEGSVRARQDRRQDPVGDKVLPITIHGDAAFAGQGVVMETFQMSQTRAYRTGGTIRITQNSFRRSGEAERDSGLGSRRDSAEGAGASAGRGSCGGRGGGGG